MNSRAVRGPLWGRLCSLSAVPACTRPCPHSPEVRAQCVRPAEALQTAWVPPALGPPCSGAALMADSSGLRAGRPGRGSGEGWTRLLEATGSRAVSHGKR